MSTNCATCLSGPCTDLIANPTSDLTIYSVNNGSIFFNDQFILPANCPPGYRCPGRGPIIIPPRILPPVIPQNGVARINCCQTPLTATIPPGSTQSQINAIVANLFYQCAIQYANCQMIGGGPGGIPPPAVPIIRGNPGRNPVTVFNQQQCFTAFCSVLPGGSITICTPAGTFSDVADNGSPADIAIAQGITNNWALENATQSAQQQALAACTVCNAFLHEFVSCPGNPGVLCSQSIQPNTYCATMGTPQAQVDSQASLALANQLTNCLIGLGCASCQGPIVTGSVISVHGACGCLQLPQWHAYCGAPIPTNFIGDVAIGDGTCGPTLDANTLCGPHAGQVTLTPNQNPFTTLQFYFP